MLANPCVHKTPLDSLKYIPLFGNPDAYISLGAILRERVEMNDTPLFGLGPSHDDTYLLQRLDLRADIRLGSHVQFLVQFEDAQPYGKDLVSPFDINPLDLRQAFVAISETLGPGTVKFRVGRQEMAFDWQRFISVLDGPNVRQAFDAIWADHETGPWRWIAYALATSIWIDALPFVFTARAAKNVWSRSGAAPQARFGSGFGRLALHPDSGSSQIVQADR
ncbi:hypothetical protein BSU04_37200 [Caballeronia sordidicola]|uniref:Alginate export domain-containing protein n=1 Tax=Caballeronia sordidicola TaxID=196367 RepID=A0A226WQD2_CABSO|nr:hypothetical protein BSU04_37200 [Caballeronia sordidicola]